MDADLDSDAAASMDVTPAAHAGLGSWLTLPSAGRIAGFGLLVFALLVFYEQVKMFLYRRATSPPVACRVC